MIRQRRFLDEVADGALVATSRQDATTSTILLSRAPENRTQARGRSEPGVPAFLVDPAWLPGELAGLAGELSRRNIRVTAAFSTHAHHDHLLWHPGFGSVPRWASPRTCILAQEERVELLNALGPDWPSELKHDFAQVKPLAGTTIPEPFGTDGPNETIEVITHNGHAPGHSALWLADRRVLIAGDMLSDTELPLPFSPDDLPSYLAALETLTPYIHRAHVLIPGHGTPTTEPVSRLDADRRYLDSVLAGQEPGDPRLDNPGMAAIHAHLLELAQQLR